MTLTGYFQTMDSVQYQKLRGLNMGSRFAMRWLIQIFAVSVITTVLLMIHLSRSQNRMTQEEAIELKKEAIRNNFRRERLTELQKTLFVEKNRPPDRKFNINVTRSEEISLERDIPDTRADSCKMIRYDVSSLPTISVIIPFYNEALSMLLRTVHSILNRTPPQLLQEVILVKDHASNKDLGETLENYLKYLPKVKLVQTMKREGLIRARMIGAGMARGEVIMFQVRSM